MSKSSTVITLGILVLLLPFIYIFRSWKDVVTFILGVLIVWTGNKMRKGETPITIEKREEERSDLHA